MNDTLLKRSRVIYNTPHDMPWGRLVSLDFYIGGLSAGLFLLATLNSVFGLTKYMPFERIAYISAMSLILFGIFLLTIELPQPTKIYTLFFRINWTSPISNGVFILTLYFIVGLVYGWYLFKGDEINTKILGMIEIPLAIGVGSYTGFVLLSAKGRKLWNYALIPLHFLVSALASGTALLILIIILKEHFFANIEIVNQYFLKIDKLVIAKLGNILVVLIIINLFLILADVLMLVHSGPIEYASAMLLLKGTFRTLFLTGQIFLGLIVPLVLLSVPIINKTVVVQMAASLLVLIGAYVMRYVVVRSGQYLPLT